MATGNGQLRWPMELDKDNEATLVEAQLEGRGILAFSAGGERRLCLPQLLSRVLLCAGATLADIQLACEQLSVTCRRCNSRQLAALSGLLELPDSCGLMRQSDAERLCKALLAGRLPRLHWPDGVGGGVAVKHLCFGKQAGLLLPRLFTRPGAPCIVCSGCSALLSTAQFVGHAHGNREAAATCHWGFDSANWRLYLSLDRRRAEPRGAALLEMVKAKVWLKRAGLTHQQRSDVGRCGGDAKKRRSSSAQEEVRDMTPNGTWERNLEQRQLGESVRARQVQCGPSCDHCSASDSEVPKMPTYVTAPSLQSFLLHEDQSKLGYTDRTPTVQTEPILRVNLANGYSGESLGALLHHN